MKLQSEIDRVFAAALANNPGEWDALVRSFGLAPLTADQRAFIRGQAGVPKLKGVLPVELRVVLEALRARAPAGTDAMELKTFVDRELLRFVAAAQPPKSVLPNICVNAQASAVRMSADASIGAKKCPCCGAARAAGSDLQTCAFCGTTL